MDFNNFLTAFDSFYTLVGKKVVLPIKTNWFIKRSNFLSYKIFFPTSTASVCQCAVLCKLPMARSVRRRSIGCWSDGWSVFLKGWEVALPRFLSEHLFHIVSSNMLSYFKREKPIDPFKIGTNCYFCDEQGVRDGDFSCI